MKLSPTPKFTKSVICALFLTGAISACKKDKAPDQIPQKTELSASIDGTSYTVPESGLSASLFQDNGDPVKALEVSAKLDNTGKQITLFLNDLKDGTILLAPKLGSSINPKTQPVAQVKDIINQYYVKYVSGGNSFYAYKGTIEVKIVNNVLTYKWDITFKDATGKDFPSTGTLTYDLSKATTKSKADEKDPTPLSPKPTLENMTPNAGPASIDVTITGVNYSTTLADNVVKFNGTDAVVKSATSTQLVVTSPANGTTGPVTIKVKNSEVVTGPVFTYQQPATVLSVSPPAGKVGDAVTILGTNFSPVAANNVVKFNGTVATVTTAIAGSLQVTVPAGATTGPVTVSVNGATAVTGPQFTVNTAGSGSGGGVEYVNVMSGNATFSKLLTADNEIYTMYVDKASNILYYSDYSSGVATNTVYKVSLSGGSPAKFSADTRIKNIANISTDAQGNLYFLSCQDNFFQKVTVYKSTADGATITEIAKDIQLFGDGARKLYIDSQGTIWLGHSDKIDTTTGKLTYVSSHSANSAVDGPIFKGDIAYVANYSTYDVVYKQLNLVSGTAATTDFTLQSLFKQDDSKITDNSDGPRLMNYALDNNENTYVLYPLSYQPGQLTQTYLIRKTKFGSGISSLITKFNTKFSSSPNYIEPQGIVAIKPIFVADGAGNLYLKYNAKDIVKISQ